MDLTIYTGLMFAIVWKSFDMTAELKNWVFEWIGGSPRSMGENDSQAKHIMGAVGTATRSGESAMGAGARGSSDADKVGAKGTAPKGGGNENKPLSQSTKSGGE